MNVTANGTLPLITSAVKDAVGFCVGIGADGSRTVIQSVLLTMSLPASLVTFKVTVYTWVCKFVGYVHGVFRVEAVSSVPTPGSWYSSSAGISELRN